MTPTQAVHLATLPPHLAAKLRNLPPEQLTQLLTTKEPTK